MSGLVWIHDDCLSPKLSILEGSAETRAVYVFDEAFIEARQYGLKRLTFIYECLLEMPVTIHRGPLAETLTALAADDGADRIVTLETPDPALRATIETLRRSLDAEAVSPPPFTTVSGKLDLKRFSRYWKKAQHTAFLPTVKQG